MGKDNGETLDGLRRVDDLPPWARHLSQPRDPEDGFLWPRRCGRSGSGHTPNVVQIKVCLRDTPRKGKLLGVEDNVISVDFGDQIVRYRNHEPERLLEIVGIGGTVRVFSSLLQSWSDYCFSIVDADAQWIPCDNEPLRSTTRGIDMTQPILLAPVTRAIAQLISEWADDFDSWPLEDDEIDLIAYNIANELSAQPDPSDPRRWWITLPSDDETLH